MAVVAVSGWRCSDDEFFEEQAVAQAHEDEIRWVGFKAKVLKRLEAIPETPDKITVVEVAGTVKALCEKVIA